MRKVWVRRAPASSTALEWFPASVLKDSEGSDSTLLVQLESWESLNRKRSSVDSESDSDSDDGGDQNTEEGEEEHVKLEDVLERNEWDFPPEDLVQLVHLHEPAILQALCERFWNSTIYTWCGPILLAMNPFERLPLYRASVLDHYRSSKEEGSQVDPHVYAVAAAAYASLVDKSGRDGGDMDQSILISGESGAGKTESTKIVMQYLATVARRPKTDGSEQEETLHVSEYLAADEQTGGGDTGGGQTKKVEKPISEYSIEQQVLESNPILEAFGNARTIRNDNSSRFGKFIQIQFDEQGFLVGATISSYLLEKVRIIHQGDNERGYHVFYQMLTGGSDEEKSNWYLESDDHPEDFEFLNNGDCYDRRDGVNDADQLRVTQRAMDIMGISKEEQHAVFQLVAAVLHLGNLEFVQDQSGKAGSSSEDSAASSTVDVESQGSLKALEAIEKLFGLPREQIIKALCTRNVNAGGETFNVPLSPDLAADTRDALAKSAYSRAFDWLVSRVNACIKSKTKVRRFIGVLDIFGFEIFTHNSFEQLCINYANERLQQQFNDFVFRHEQSIYAKEKINWSFIDFPSNAATVSLIDGSAPVPTSSSGSNSSPQPASASSSSSSASTAAQMAILTILDDECRLPKGNDQGFVRKLYESCESHDRFSASKSQRVRGEFVVKHYAGDVVYNSEGFCEKNRDALRQEAVDLMMTSSSDFVRSLFEEEKGDKSSKSSAKKVKRQSSNSEKQQQRRSAISLVSVGAEFKKQLSALIDTVTATAPHYIRCIKPNDHAKAKLINRPRVVAQLRCGGVLEAVRVARAGFPIRMPHKTFVARYGRIVGPASLKMLFHHDANVSPAERKTVLNVLEKVPQANSLEKSDARSLAKSIIQVLCKCNTGENIEDCSQVGKTKVFMRKHGHDMFERWLGRWKRYAAHKVTAVVMGNAVRTHFDRVSRSVRLIQRVIRGGLGRVRARVARRERAALKIQACLFAWTIRSSYVRTRNAILALQAVYRGGRDRALASTLRVERARLRLQKWSRGYRIRRDFILNRRAAVRLQCAIRSSLARSEFKKRRREARDLSSIVQERDKLREQVQQLRKQLASSSGVQATSTSQVCAHVHDGTSTPSLSWDATPELRRRSILIAAASYTCAILWKNLHRFKSDAVKQYFESRALHQQSIPRGGEEETIPTVDNGTAGNMEAVDWYKRTFGEELEQLDQATLAGVESSAVTTDEKVQHHTDNENKVEKEIREQRERVELKRLELEEMERKLREEQQAIAAAARGEGEEHDGLRSELERTNALLVEREDELDSLRRAFEELARDQEEQARADSQVKLEEAQEMFEEKMREIEAAHAKTLAEKEAQQSALEEELEEVKKYLGSLTGQKNQSEIKQGELELEVSALKGELAAAAAKHAALAEEKKKVEAQLDSVKLEIQTNRDVTKSAAVLQLESEIRNAHAEADSLKAALQKAKTESDLLRNENQIKAMAMEDFRETMGTKVKSLEREVAAIARAKQKAEGYLKARILIDRRSRRVAQNVVNVWAAFVRERKELRVRAKCAARVFLSRKVAKAFRTWVSNVLEDRAHDLVIERHRKQVELRLLRQTFRTWTESVRRARHVDLLSLKLMEFREDLTLSRVFSSWRQYAVLRMEEESRFDRLAKVFFINKVRRHFFQWRAVVRKSIRLCVLLSVHQANEDRKRVGKVFYSWARIAARRADMQDVSSREGTPVKSQRGAGEESASQADVVAVLMHRLEQQDAKLEALLREKAATHNEPPLLTNGDLYIENGEVDTMTPRVEQLASSDEEDSFYQQRSPALGSIGVPKNLSRRSKSERFTPLDSGTGFGFETPRTGRFRSGFRSGRMSMGGSMRNVEYLDDSDDSPQMSRQQHQKKYLSERRMGGSLRHRMGSSATPHLDLARDLDMVANDEEVAVGESMVQDWKPQVDLDNVVHAARSCNVAPIILAAEHGLGPVLYELLQNGADPNVVDGKRNRTPLQTIIHNHQYNGDGSEQMVEYLLEAGADPNVRNSQGNTALMEAARKGDEAIGISKALIRHGALKNSADGCANYHRETPLHATARVGGVKTAHLLLEQGSSLSQRDSQGQTALHIAGRVCNVKMLQILLADKSMSRRGGVEESNERLTDIQDNAGNTALHLVCATTSPDIEKAVYVLLGNEANPNIANASKQTPLHILASNNNLHARAALKRFVDFHAGLDKQDRNGNTALHVACHPLEKESDENMRQLACRLVKYGSPLYIQNAKKQTPLNLVPPAFAIQLLGCIRKLPDEKLMKKHHANVKDCMVCGARFSYFFSQNVCTHCGRLCCKNCTRQYPLLRFNIVKPCSLCGHCFSLINLRNGAMSKDDLDLDDDRTSEALVPR